MRRETAITLALGAVLVATLPAYARVFVDDGWRGRYLAAGLLALAITAVVRRLGGGGFVALLTSLAGLGLFTYATALPSVGLLPDATSLGTVRELLDQAVVGLREEIAPTAATPSFVFAIATGAWLASHLASELAVRFARPGAALVPFVVLWSLPLAVPMTDDASAWLRALPLLVTAGVVLLLGTDHTGGRRPRLPLSGLAVGSGALALAAAAPLVVPGYGATAWVDLAGQDTPRGYQPIVDVTERLQLPTERELLTVRASERSYLRLAGLDSFDGGTWRLGPEGAGNYQPSASSLYRADAPLPPEQPAAATLPTRVEVEVQDLSNIYVPTPYQPVTFSGELTDQVVWSTDGGFLATWSTTLDEAGSGEPQAGVAEGVRYTVDAERPVPTIEQLRTVEVDPRTEDRWTALPRDYPELDEAATAVYEAAGADTTVDRALALQDWFTDDGDFTYDLDVPALRGDDSLERFILDDRRGYCEYFATAMAVMLRASDIPARVAVGFLPGTVTEDADQEAGRPLTEYSVSTSDAHAWVEVLFPGYGWITFEPTPRSDLSQIVPTAEDLAPVENLRERRVRELAELDNGDEDADTQEAPDPVPAPDEAPTDPTTPDGDTGGTADSAPWRRWAIALVGLAGAVAAVVLARRTARRRADQDLTTPRARILSSQRSLLATGRRYGIGRAPEESTAELVHRWQREGRTTADGARFAAVAQAAAFGGTVDDRIAAESERLVAELERDLRASVAVHDRVLSPVRIPLELTAAGVRRVERAVTNRRRPPEDTRAGR